MTVPRFSVRFSLDDPEQRRCWEALQALPDGKRNGYILDAMTFYRLDKKLETTLRRVLRAELAQLSVHAATPQPKAAAEIPQQALDFLASL